MSQTTATLTHDEPTQSWMASDAATQDLLYVSDVDAVLVYSYPRGKLEGVLRNFYISQGECVDQAGDVFITDQGYNKIFVYAHGSKKRQRTLTGYGGPVGCSVDPTTGDLAASAQNYGVAIYKHASGTPTVYTDSDFNEYYWCGYDDRGNVFVDGQSDKNAFEFAELSKGSSTLETITLNQSMGFPGGVLWDGKHIAVGSYYPPPSGQPVVYQFAIKGSEGTKVGTTLLGSGASDVKVFWIQGKTLVAPNTYTGGSNVLFYRYPAGGGATKTITKRILAAQSAAISLAPNR